MTFQKTVLAALAYGIAGEQAFDGAVRAEPVVLGTVFNGAADQPGPYGRALTSDESIDGVAKVVVGGTGTFIGILGDPKANPTHTALGGDAPGIEAGTHLTAISETPGMWVHLVGTGAVGDAVAFDADGLLHAAPLQVAPATTTLIPGSRIVRYDVNEGLAVVALQQLPTAAAPV